MKRKFEIHITAESFNPDINPYDLEELIMGFVDPDFVILTVDVFEEE